MGGSAKGLMLVGGETIKSRQLRTLTAVGLRTLFVVGRSDARYAPPPATVADAVPDGGALGALYTALLASPIDRVLVLACDLPFVSEPFLRHLIVSAPGYEAVVPRTARGWHPLCAVYHRRAARKLKARIDARHLRLVDALLQLQLLEVRPSEVAEFDPDGTLLTNVNTPEDYQAACRHAQARGAVSRRVPHRS